MQSDYYRTGKLYDTLEAYVRRSAPTRDVWTYFGTSVQFKSCASFKRFLEAKYPGERFAVSRA